jgi:hypothetical protein
VAERDFVHEIAGINTHFLELVRMVEDDADRAIESRDVDELIAILRHTVLLLGAVAQDLVSSRAEGATEYATIDEFRRLVDEVSAKNE